MADSRAAPILLTMANFYGTLAAARSLGSSGVPVVIADASVLAPARWSRHVVRQLSCPDVVTQTNAFIDWLLQLGSKMPRAVLYPTSDDMAWLFALRQEELKASFALYQPGADVLYSLLNKKRLFELCREEGIAVPETEFPECEADVERFAQSGTFPVLLKPRTQILLQTHIKGLRVERGSALLGRYREYLRSNRYGPTVVAHDPAVVYPMIQHFHPEAAENIYSLAGFVDAQGRHAMRASVKVLQRPRKMGTGLCFEAAPVDPSLAAAVIKICRRLGYYGVFEVEFIQTAGQSLMIDFNPRFYGQMGFEISRGLPLAELAYRAALSEYGEVERLLAEASTSAASGASIYCHRMVFELMLRLQGLSGKLTREEQLRWREWYAKNRGLAADAVLDGSDVAPVFVEALSQLRSYARYPRHFIRSMVLDN